MYDRKFKQTQTKRYDVLQYFNLRSNTDGQPALLYHTRLKTKTFSIQQRLLDTNNTN